MSLIGNLSMPPQHTEVSLAERLQISTISRDKQRSNTLRDTDSMLQQPMEVISSLSRSAFLRIINPRKS